MSEELRSKDQITLTVVSDGVDGEQGKSVTSVIPYYTQQPDSTIMMSKPSTNPPPEEWSNTEPFFIPDTKVFLTFLTEFSDGNWYYSEVSEYSSYAAAVDAFDKAEEAQTTADDANAAVSELGNVIGDVEENILDVQSDVSALQDQVEAAAKQDQLDEMNELVRQYIGSEGYINIAGGTLVLGVGDFKTAITPENIVFYEGDDVVSYISNQKLYTNQTEVLEGQRIGDFVWQLREPNRLSLMYLPVGG